MFYQLSKVFFILYLFYSTWFSNLFFNTQYIIPILSVSIILFYSLHKIITKDLSITLPIPLFLFFVFFFYALITGVFIAYDNQLLFSSLFTYFNSLILMLYIVNVSITEKNNRFFVSVWLIYSGVYMVSMLLWGDDYGRLTLTEETNANEDALILLMGVFSALHLVKTNKLTQLLIAFLYVGTSIYTIMLTGSRKTFIAVILMVVLWFIFIYKDYWKAFNIQKRILLIIMFVLSIPFIFIKLLANIFESSVFLRINEKGVAIQDESGRSEMYNEAFNLFYNNPLFGVGFDQFRVYSSYNTYSHSTYGEIISTTGLIGTLIYFSAYVIIIYNFIKLYYFKKEKVIAVKSIEYLILFFILLLLGTGVIHFYSFRDNMIIAIIISFYFIEKSNKTKLR